MVHPIVDFFLGAMVYWVDSFQLLSIVVCPELAPF